MPTTQVYTWDQFTAAYTAAQGTSSDPHVIEIMADLDAASSIPREINGADRYKIINGNYHNISNLATATTFSDSILYCNHVTYNKCNFINVYRNNNYPVFYASSNYIPTFNDCVIQGQGSSICAADAASNNTGYGNYNRCVITWHQVGSVRTGSLLGNATLRYCYLDLDIITTTFDDTDIGDMYSSYLKGSIRGDVGSRTRGIAWVCSDSVINIDTDITYPRIANSAAMQTVYNNDKIPAPTSIVTNILGVTDAQLKDAAYLASIGFNIIV